MPRLRWGLRQPCWMPSGPATRSW